MLDHYAGRDDRPRLIYVSHNHEESLRAQIAESQPLFLKRQAIRFDALKVSRLERGLVDAVDFVTAITQEDLALYRARNCDKPMDVLSPGYCGRRLDERRISDALPRPPDRSIVTQSGHQHPQQEPSISLIRIITTRDLSGGVAMPCSELWRRRSRSPTLAKKR